MLTSSDLIQFERDVAEAFEAKKIHAPIHLSGGNEDALIDVFREIKPEDWVFSTWRSHYHALLKGIPPDEVMAQIMAGHSMNMNFPAHRFLTSAIVGGILPIACGVAYGIAHTNARVWCFVGDMTASIGTFHDAQAYALHNDLPITFVVEANGLSTNTPVHAAWGDGYGVRTNFRRYKYTRTYPHVGCGKYVAF